MSSGPRTAYSIFRRFVKTLSSVRTLPPVAPLAMPRRSVLSAAGRWTNAFADARRPLPPDVPDPAEVVNCSHVLGLPLVITAFHQRACGIFPLYPVDPRFLLLQHLSTDPGNFVLGDCQRLRCVCEVNATACTRCRRSKYISTR